MAMVCHGCGKPLHPQGQCCSHCGKRPEEGPRPRSAVRSRAMIWALGFGVVSMLGLQGYWRHQASEWMAAESVVRPLFAPSPPDLLVRRDVPDEPGIGPRRGVRDRRLIRRRLARRPTMPSGMNRLAKAGTPGMRWKTKGDGTRLSVSVEPRDVTTFVYLNGGALLGRAPLRDTPVRAGHHRLVFWAPSIRARATRAVELEPGQHAELSAALNPAPHS